MDEDRPITGAEPAGGLFINLFDEASLRLYLDRGLYGFHMSPVRPGEDVHNTHYRALADYACGRTGTHIFFFLKRSIIYGGQLLGDEEGPAFFLNGPWSPLGREAGAPVVWDESDREDVYEPTHENGIFRRTEDGKERCQPYLIQFEDRLDLAGSTIQSDDLYFELGSFPYPLPTNSISGMSFCTMTPAETQIALRLIRDDGTLEYEPETDEPTHLSADPLAFSTDMVPNNASDCENESHLEASSLANSDLLPEALRPRGAVPCRQVPISPFKPSQMDRADICYYEEPVVREGTIPNRVIELKKVPLGIPAVRQVRRYLDWLHKILGDDAQSVTLYLFGPRKARTFKLPSQYEHQIEVFTYGT